MLGNSLKHNKNFICIFCIIAFLTFFRIASFDIQPWDEGLYAYRALAGLEHSTVFDQTQYSLAGLYSSTPPPLSVWMMSISYKIFGINEFAVRLMPAICSLIAIILLYKIICLYNKKNTAGISVLMAGLSLVWNYYSRQAMTEIPVITFILFNLFSLLKILVFSSGHNKRILYYILYILSFAAALLTKYAVSFLPIVFVIAAFNSLKTKQQLKNIIISVVVAVAIAAPWYIYMSIYHGFTFSSSLILKHVYSAVEGNSKNSYFYYINQLLISNPFFIICFVSPFIFIFTNSKNSKLCHYRIDFNYIKNKISALSLLDRIFLIWLIASLGIFSISITKLPHYTTYITVPAAYFTAKFLLYLYKNYKSSVCLIILLVAATFIWALSESIRNSAKTLSPHYSILTFIALFITLLLSIFLIIFINYKFRTKFSEISDTLYQYSFFIFAVILFFNTLSNNSLYFRNIHNGGRQLALYYKNQEIDKLTHNPVFLFHSLNPQDSTAPQLKWYLHINKCNTKFTHIMLDPNHPTLIDNSTFSILKNSRIIIYQSPALPQVQSELIHYLKPVTAKIIDYGFYLLIFTK